MTDDKKKPEDETPKAQAEDAKPSEDLSDEELSKAAGGAAYKLISRTSRTAKIPSPSTWTSLTWQSLKSMMMTDDPDALQPST